MTSRLKAFLIHLLISACIAAAVIFVVFVVWYPAPLHTAVGVTQIFLILLAVDVVLGPLLTLLVYKVGKKTLVMDLTVIALLQLSALGYGLSTVAEGRPAWLVYGANRFELVRALDIDERNTGTHATYAKPSWFGPQWVGAVSPIDLNARNDILFEAVGGGFDIYQRPNLYRPLTDVHPSIQRNLENLGKLARYNTQAALDAVLSNHPTADAWLPLRANNQDMVVLMQKDTLEVLAIVDLRPWD